MIHCHAFAGEDIVSTSTLSGTEAVVKQSLEQSRTTVMNSFEPLITKTVTLYIRVMNITAGNLGKQTVGPEMKVSFVHLLATHLNYLLLHRNTRMFIESSRGRKDT